MIRVTDYPGITGDYTTDCFPRWQTLIAQASSGLCFEVPPGQYRVSQPLDFSSLGDCSLKGYGGQRSVIVSAGEGRGPAVKTIGNILLASGMGFVGNPTKGGIGFYGENTQSCSFTDCRFAGAIGADMRQPFLTNWHHCQFNGQNGRGQDNGSKIGLQIHQGTACSVTGSGDFTGWNEGLRCTGAGVNIHAARFEVNGIGMRLGCDPDGNPYGLSGSHFAGISGEANDTYVRLQVCGSCTFASVGGQGSGNSPSAGSVYGWDIQTAHGCTFQGIQFGGATSKAALFLRDSDENQNLIFQGCELGNDTGRVWDKPSKQLCTQRKTFFYGCNEAA